MTGKTLTLFAIILFASINSFGQVSIGSATINEFNLRSDQIFNMTLLNNGSTGTVLLQADITNSAGNKLLTVKSQNLQIQPGLTAVNYNNIQIASAIYGGSSQSTYLKNFGRLSSGLFSICYRVIPVAGFEDGDDYCQEINSTENEFLDLVYPAHLDTIETKLPVLNWTHSEAFNLLAEGEFYRLILVEKKKDQSAESAVKANIPMFSKSYLRSHQVPYDFDAKELEEGKTYAWYVSKMSNGLTINRTEAWEFTVKKNTIPVPHKYVELKTDLDGSFYSVVDGRIYFKLSETYEGSDLDFTIKSDNGQLMTAEVKNEKHEALVARGYNTYELDLSTYNLKKGYYVLNVKGVKGDNYLLKFYED